MSLGQIILWVLIIGAIGGFCHPSPKVTRWVFGILTFPVGPLLWFCIRGWQKGRHGVN